MTSSEKDQTLLKELDRIEEGIALLSKRVQLLEEQRALAANNVQSNNNDNNNNSSSSSSNLNTSNENWSETVLRLQRICLEKGLYSARFKKAPADYYEKTLEERRDILGAFHIDQLCKTIILENTLCTEPDCRDRTNSRYYAVVIQYTAKLNSQKLMNYVRKTLGRSKVPKSNFSFSLAPEEVSEQLTGYKKGSVTPIGMRTPDIPIILDEKIAKLKPSIFWIGGGEIDVKLELATDEFINVMNAFVADVTF